MVPVGSHDFRLLHPETAKRRIKVRGVNGKTLHRGTESSINYNPWQVHLFKVKVRIHILDDQDWNQIKFWFLC